MCPLSFQGRSTSRRPSCCSTPEGGTEEGVVGVGGRLVGAAAGPGQGPHRPPVLPEGHPDGHPRQHPQHGSRVPQPAGGVDAGGGAEHAVFTAVFCLEMALKVRGGGRVLVREQRFQRVRRCHRPPQPRGGVPEQRQRALGARTFRLLRILKLVRFLPALRRQLLVMLRTVDNVAVFFALLPILFIFIFSILGMNLFGCKFCKTLPDGKTHCDRKNFDSLLWAIVTVFQILTQEDWNVVLFNGMEKTSHWAALYFVALMTFGNYVLFNLLVAILVEGFSQEDDKRESSRSCSLCEKQDCEDSFDDPKDNIEKEIKMRAYPYVLRVVKGGASTDLCFPPVITHTAATPQGSPNALQRISPGPDLNGVLTSLPIPGLPPSSRRSSVIVALSRHSSIVSNISRKSSLGQCFSLQAGWRRKRSDSSDNGSEEVVLNNMSPGPEAGHCNGSIPTLQNTPNNKVGGSPRASSNSLHSGSRDEFKPNNLDSAPDTPTQKMCWCFEPKGWMKDRGLLTFPLLQVQLLPSCVRAGVGQPVVRLLHPGGDRLELRDAGHGASHHPPAQPRAPPAHRRQLPLHRRLHLRDARQGGGAGAVVRSRRLLQERLEHDGRHRGHHLPGGRPAVLRGGRQPQDLRDAARLPTPALTQTPQSDQPSPGAEAGGADPSLVPAAHRQHRAHLLHLLHHLRHPGSAVVQGQLLYYCEGRWSRVCATSSSAFKTPATRGRNWNSPPSAMTASVPSAVQKSQDGFVKGHLSAGSGQVAYKCVSSIGF
ncbi:voltage-dependent T-type calcium channel subunit alpha-1H [Caerostris extrusa]|uniref:Voltage-dependent T-type calcium channel subunit alpha-1H n=1 Tax=Caerostris extrusa TaxID=172846 RepID=A0AAV4YD30_CAEEX|nr:voltage-dependent T-type calcium channel subunit alpha-1H [Caerostris extrusa]